MKKYKFKLYNHIYNSNYCSSASNATGFSLIEVLISVLVIAIAVISLQSTISNQSSTYIELEDRIFAAILAENHLNTIIASDDNSFSEEQIEFQNKEWTIRTEYLNTLLPGVLQVKIMVFYANFRPSKGSIYTLNSVVYR